ncbi:hypothetical protein ScPMuIL_016848 [Solemya velum]
MCSCRALLIGFLVVFTVLVEEASSLKCYVCAGARSNDECSKPEHLQTCPDDEFQVCETDVSYEKSRGFEVISKQCANGPCELDGGQGKVISMCNRDQPDWSCMSCCQTDGCNKDGATVTSVNIMTVVSCVLLSSFVTLKVICGNK